MSNPMTDRIVTIVYSNCRNTIHTLLRQTKQYRDEMREARKLAKESETPK